MILRILITTMMLLAIAKYYLHDTKQSQQIKSSQQAKDIQNQLNEAQHLQQEQRKKQLDAMDIEN